MTINFSINDSTNQDKLIIFLEKNCNFNFIPIEKLWALGALPFLPAEILKISILAIFITVLSKDTLSWRSLRKDSL